MRWMVTFSAVMLFAISNGTASEPQLFWCDISNDWIWRSNMDGSDPEVIVDSDAGDLAIDAQAEKIYWSSRGQKIRQASLNGLGKEDVVTGRTFLGGIDIDTTEGKLYWFEDDPSNPPVTVLRANLNGTDIEELFHIPGAIRSASVDPIGDKLYWTVETSPGGKIQRANFDGTGLEDVKIFVDRVPYAITLDVVGRKMYWTDILPQAVSRANLDGSDVEEILPHIGYSRSIAFAPNTQKIYWIERNGAGDTVRRANPNGSDTETVATDTFEGVFGGLATSDFVLPWNAGDMNLDREVNGLDVAPFVYAVINEPFNLHADMNGDGAVTGLDVAPFVDAVIAGSVQAVPEPSTLVLASFALFGLLCWRRKGR